MTIKSIDLADGVPTKGRSPLTINRVLAVVGWLVGAAATYLGVQGMSGAPWTIALTFAIVTQLLLTWAERAMWRGKPSGVAALALLLDVALNAGGVYPYIRRAGETPVGVMLADVFGGSQVGPWPAIIVSVVVGFLIAAAPEELWTRRD